MLEGSLLALNVLGMLMIMFWCIRKERTDDGATETSDPGADPKDGQRR